VDAAAVAAVSATFAASAATLVAALIAPLAKFFSDPNPKGMMISCQIATIICNNKLLVKCAKTLARLL
jgi:hypothetical protein